MECCPYCSKEYTRKNKRTKHHIYPRRWFKKSEIIYICRKCHSDLEKNIPFEKIEKEKYYDIFIEWRSRCAG